MLNPIESLVKNVSRTSLLSCLKFLKISVTGRRGVILSLILLPANECAKLRVLRVLHALRILSTLQPVRTLVPYVSYIACIPCVLLHHTCSRILPTQLRNNFSDRIMKNFCASFSKFSVFQKIYAVRLEPNLEPLSTSKIGFFANNSG